MDYRYYRGDRIEISPAIAKRLYLLHPICALMISTPPILAVLMMVDFINLSLFWFFARILIGTFGNVFFIIGMTYDTIIDWDGKKHSMDR